MSFLIFNFSRSNSSRSNFSRFSLSRLLAIMIKEFAQMRRDPVTIGMLIMIPLIQLVLFGFAINTNPRHLPTVIVSADESMYTREFITGVQNTKYFQILSDPKNHIQEPMSVVQANRLLTQGKALFIIQIPPNFTRDLLRNKHPELLITADATDPSATGNAISALQQLATQVFTLDLSRGLNNLNPGPPVFNLIIHAKYNPSSITSYNIIPGLMGVILTMTLVMITGLAITREREFGTMESLLSTPVKPLEVMIGKILPYIIVGYVQQAIILVAAQTIFSVPNAGSILLLILCQNYRKSKPPAAACCPCWTVPYRPSRSDSRACAGPCRRTCSVCRARPCRPWIAGPNTCWPASDRTPC